MTVRDTRVPAATLNLPQAARWQREVTLADLALTDYVRLRRPRVRWWWGQVKHGGWTHAECHLCRDRIVSWDMRHPITRVAQDEIALHRAGHASGRLQSIGSDTSASLAGGGRSPTGGQ